MGPVKAFLPIQYVSNEAPFMRERYEEEFPGEDFGGYIQNWLKERNVVPGRLLRCVSLEFQWGFQR